MSLGEPSKDFTDNDFADNKNLKYINEDYCGVDNDGPVHRRQVHLVVVVGKAN